MKPRSESQPASYSGIRDVIFLKIRRPERKAGNSLLSSDETELCFHYIARFMVSTGKCSPSRSVLLYAIVESRFTTVRFTTIHFYDPCRVGPSTPDLRYNTVANQASVLYSVRF